MTAGLILVLAVVVAYLATHVAFDWLARRYLIVSGAEYLILGFLLGPEVAGVLSTELLESFAPLVALTLGWIGAIVGMQFYLPGLLKIARPMYKLAFFEALLTLVFVSGVLGLVFMWLTDLPYIAALVPAVALGAIATVSGPTGIEVVARQLGRRGPIVRQLELATGIEALVAVLALGILVSINHPLTLEGVRRVTPTEWVVITLGIGLIGGALFHLFLGDEADSDRLFISVAGAIVLTSGAAAYLQLSPLLTSMIMGTVLVNTSASRQEILRTLSRSERPFYFVMLVFAGALWQPALNAWWAVPVVVFLLARTFSKTVGARVGARLNHMTPVVGPHWGRALLGQGGLAVALALNYLQFGNALYPNTVFTAAIASVLLTDAASARLIQSVVAPVVESDTARSQRRLTPVASEPAITTTREV